MIPQEGVIFLVSADAALTQQLINELVAAGTSGPGPADRDRFRPPRG